MHADLQQLIIKLLLTKQFSDTMKDDCQQPHVVYEKLNILKYISCGSRGAKGAMAPLSLLKLIIKKMAAIGGPLYFMLLAPPPL